LASHVCTTREARGDSVRTLYKTWGGCFHLILLFVKARQQAITYVSSRQESVLERVEWSPTSGFA
jgi:hypothetical protein